jgi:hypothetical protein
MLKMIFQARGEKLQRIWDENQPSKENFSSDILEEIKKEIDIKIPKKSKEKEDHEDNRYAKPHGILETVLNPASYSK